MEELIKSKQFKIMFIIFIIASVFHILYATLTYRGLYMNGTCAMIIMLNKIAANTYHFFFETICSKSLIETIQILPVAILGLFPIQNKFVFMGTYSFSQIAAPFFILIWNYFLSKRTGKTNVFYWSLFCYAALILPCLIVCNTQSHIGIMLLFVLWNYFVADIDYKKYDIVLIFFLTLSMFGYSDYISYIGIIFFYAYMFYRKKDDSFKNKTVKSIIGFGSLFASIYSIIVSLSLSNIRLEIQGVFNELTTIWPFLLSLNSVFTILALLLTIIFFFRKTELGKVNTNIFCLFMLALIFLAGNKFATIHPMWEGHFMTFASAVPAIIFIWLYINDKYFKIYDNIRSQNLICIMLMLGIFQTFWQIVETSYWHKNILYMQEELAKEETPLYVPSKHEELMSDFNEPNLRRFIWHWLFIQTSILFADEYKPKTILLNYDNPIDEANLTYREYIYVPNYRQDLLNIPPDIFINQKNKFWDLTDIAKAIDKYNKEHNIKTDG